MSQFGADHYTGKEHLTRTRERNDSTQGSLLTPTAAHPTTNVSSRLVMMCNTEIVCAMVFKLVQALRVLRGGIIEFRIFTDLFDRRHLGVYQRIPRPA
jgi:hypothetical protein